jgi:hypothetical protein
VEQRISAFVEVAQEYCAFIENGGADRSWSFAKQCLTLLLRLYERALNLPEREPASDSSLTRVKHEGWQEQFDRLGQKLVRDLYWQVFEPFDQEKPEPLCGSISDDLADIWRDLKVGLAEMDKCTAGCIEDAVWHWRFSFETHWAYHAAGAIAALTALCFGPYADTTRAQ